MRINKIILENFGLYRGKHIFDLVPRSDGERLKPIILFGGRNGAGKTTFLNSIRLALYGKNSLGNRTSQKQYEEYLLNKIHRHPNSVLQPRFARIAIEFSFVSQGEMYTDYIERSWVNDKKKAKEELLILKDGKPLDRIDAEFWDTFISDIIPERLSQLFFFDGEKIQDIADDIKGNEAIAEAIKTLLGLDLIDKLQTDLKIFKSKEAKKFSSAVDRKILDRLDTDIEEYRTDINTSYQTKASLLSEKEGLQCAVDKLEKSMRSKGSLFADAREENLIQSQVISTKIEEIDLQIYRECSGIFPLALCPSISKVLKRQISDEDRFRKQSIIASEIKSLEAEVISSIENLSDFDANLQHKLIAKISSSFKKRCQIDNSTTELLGFAPTEAESVRTSLMLSVDNSASNVLELCRKLESQHQGLIKVQNSIKQAPDDNLLQDDFNQISYHSQQIGELTQKIKKNEDNLKSFEYQMGLLTREKLKLEDKQKEFESFQMRAGLVDNVNSTLQKYHNKLTALKINLLRQEVVSCFNTITRKSGFITDVKIDSKSFEVTLFNRQNKAVPKEDLSSGEKQIFAIAFLWALAKTSGRPLPIIIDTPLGRLDSEHRENLVKNYFPKASHQTILFSTDTEVDEELFQELSSSISHCYHLHFDKKDFNTTPKEEYFWKHEELENDRINN